MGEYHYLQGSEDVRSAGAAMREAASQMQTAAATIDHAVFLLGRKMDEFIAQLNDTLEADRKARLAGEVDRG